MISATPTNDASAFPVTVESSAVATTTAVTLHLNRLLPRRIPLQRRRRPLPLPPPPLLRLPMMVTREITARMIISRQLTRMQESSCASLKVAMVLPMILAVVMRVPVAVALRMIQAQKTSMAVVARVIVKMTAVDLPRVARKIGGVDICAGEILDAETATVFCLRTVEVEIIITKVAAAVMINLRNMVAAVIPPLHRKVRAWIARVETTVTVLILAPRLPAMMRIVRMFVPSIYSAESVSHLMMTTLLMTSREIQGPQTMARKDMQALLMMSLPRVHQTTARKDMRTHLIANRLLVRQTMVNMEKTLPQTTRAISDFVAAWTNVRQWFPLFSLSRQDLRRS